MWERMPNREDAYRLMTEHVKNENLQKIMTFLDIFAKEKSSPNDFKNFPLRGIPMILGHSVINYICLLIGNIRR